MSSRIDAVKIPNELVADVADPGERKAAVVELAEEALGIDPASAELAWAHEQQGFYFAAREPGATLFHPNAGDRPGAPRYRWARRDDGVELGTLDDGATAQAA